jgi:outer membrane protein assembly factor BamE (lipoprotein component of BamABCDE complex)
MSNKEYMQWAWFYVFENKKRNEEIAIAEAEAKKRRK